MKFGHVWGILHFETNPFFEMTPCQRIFWRLACRKAGRPLRPLYDATLLSRWKNGPNHTMTSPRQNTENKSIGQNNSVSLTINIQQYHFHHIHIMTHHENHLKSDWNNPVLLHRLDPQATFSRPLSILLWHAPTDPSPAFGGKTRWIGPSIPEEFHNGRVVQLNSYFDGKNRAHLDAAGLEAPGAENILKAMTFQEGHHQLLVAVSYAWWLGRPIRPIDRFEDERGRWNRENEEKKHHRQG